MQPVTWEDLTRPGGLLDAWAAKTPDVDPFCSGSAWQASAAMELVEPRTLTAFVSEHGVMATMRHQERIEPLEFSWCLGSPLLGTTRLVRDVAAILQTMGSWQTAYWPGLCEGAPMVRALATEHPFGLARGATTVRHVIDLQTDANGYWSRRSRDLRKSVRRAATRAGEHQVRAVRATSAECDAAPLMQRILTVDQTTWKGQQGVGLADPRFAAFYQRMLSHLGPGRTAAWFAQQDGRDVGYLLGAWVGRWFRGLQFGYTSTLRSLSLGSHLLACSIEDVAADGAEIYDLGAEMDYKRRWADRELRSDLWAWVRR